MAIIRITGEVMLIFDIETDDLNPSLIHCIVAKDRETGPLYYLYDNQTLGYKELP